MGCRDNPGIKEIGYQSFCVGNKATLNHEGHEDHEVDVNRK